MDIDNVIVAAIAASASDVHITPGKSPLFRKLGVLTEYTQQGAVTMEAIEEFIMKHKLNPRFVTTIGVRDRMARISLAESYAGICVAIRILDCEPKSFEDLHLPNILKSLCNCKQGLYLITGSTGSGKSTTAAAIINGALGARDLHVLSLENPIEYVFQSRRSQITQREYGKHFSSFPDATREAMYQDPDLIYFGELNDYETIQNALTLAETGHFVIATLHARGAVETVTRIVDIFESSRQDFVKAQLLAVLKGVCWQALISNGSEQYPLTEVMTMSTALRGMYSQNKAEAAIRGELEMQPCCVSRIASALSLRDNNIQPEAVWNYLTESERVTLNSRINRGKR